MNKMDSGNFTPLLSASLPPSTHSNHFCQLLMSPPSESFLQIQANMKIPTPLILSPAPSTYVI